MFHNLSNYICSYLYEQIHEQSYIKNSERDMSTVIAPKKRTPKETSKPQSMIKKMLEDKEAIVSYFRGELTLKELDARGIKLG
ncbi:hypothetical protein Runsl_5848 (plasmid) [Runella slithyformis DSM 19594]|uniref:Uncharacterized protein n=2 Tax=Runella TaxID=105 RepID=A0A7U3ZRP9_RUNSL|nr:hypothetical protein Runsl_5848 [Runella slithyformis DSM 19594]